MEKQIVVERKNTRMKTAVMACALTLCLGAGGALAWFTATDTVENKLSVSDLGNGDDTVQVVEPSWDPTDDDSDGVPDAAQNILPTQTIAKDPQIKNNSDAEVWVIAELKMPVDTVKVLNADGTTPEAAAETELYDYTIDTANWEAKGAPVKDVTDGKGFYTQTYVYKTKLAAGATSEKLFDGVSLKNLADAQGVSGAQNITVTVKAIQTEGVATIDDAMSYYAAQNA